MNDSFDSRLPDSGNNAASMNGTATLSERVRELRLTGKIDGRKGGSGGSSWLPWTLCILLAFAWGFIGIRWYRTGSLTVEGATPTSTEKGATPTATVPKANSFNPSTPGSNAGDATTLLPSDDVVLEGKGNIIPAHQISVSPVDVVGRIIELYIEEGKAFKEGEILAVIDATRYRADYDFAVASARAAEARFEESKVSRELQVDQAEFEVQGAKRGMEKARNLYETNKRNYENRSKSISDLELMQSEKDYLMSSMQVGVSERKRDLLKGRARDEQIKALEQEWKSNLARAAQAKWFLDNCTIKSPVTGVILTKKAERGNLINPVVGGVSTNLCDIADLSDLEVDLEVQERDLKKFFVGQACKIRVDAYPERIYEGYVDRAMPIANRARGILPVRIKIVVPATEEQGKYLKPEMGMTVGFLNKMSTDPKWLAKQPEIYPKGLPKAKEKE